MFKKLILLALALALVAAACGSDDDSSSESTEAEATEEATEDPAEEATEDPTEDPTEEATEDPTEEATEDPTVDGIITVGSGDEDFDSVQAAVDAAAPGDLILISPGEYSEAVDVTTDNLTIRGLDRNEVILDGGGELDNGIRVLGAGGVAIENMTARNYTTNGFFWTGVDGYRGSYLTAYHNGDYGVYAFGSVNGQWDNSYGSGSPDAGFYIGECYPCNAVIDNVISDYNGLGYSGTDSGGDLYIVNSVFTQNRGGIVPSSGGYHLCYPERETTIVGNLVYDNNNAESPAKDLALLTQNTGIVIGGGHRNLIERNRVDNHGLGGIVLALYPEDTAPISRLPTEEELELPCDEQPDLTGEPEGTLIWESYDNVVRSNVVSNTELYDLGWGAVTATEDFGGNCFSDNTYETSSPPNIDETMSCDGPRGTDTSEMVDVVTFIAREVGEPGEVGSTPVPPAQPNMPDAATAPANPATDVPYTVDLDSIDVPELIEG